MKAQTLNKLLTAVVFTCIVNAAVAQPSWSVSPNLYDYSMTVTGKIFIDGITSVDVNDKIAAFIGGQCRGVVNVKYQSALKDYFVFLMIYSNEPTGLVSFKIFDASENKEFDVGSTINFSINGIVGSVNSPHEFKVFTTTNEAKILSFTIPDQEGFTSIWNNSVTLTQKVTGDLSNIAPVFTLSDGAKAYVNNVLQVSGSTVNNFRNSVQYKIVPMVGNPQYYWVTIFKGIDTSTKIMLSKVTVPENKDSVLVGELSAESEYLGSSYVFSLESVAGAENQFFYLIGNRLFVKNAFNYEIKSQYRVNIQVANYAGISKQTLFTITVTDQNDPPTGISLSSYTIKESTGENEVVARFIVDDEDKNDTHLFSFVSGNEIGGIDNSYFLIKGDSLLLKNKITQLGKEHLKIGIRVTDKSGAYFEKELSLQVVDIKSAPQFISEPLSYVLQNQIYVYHIKVADNGGGPLVISFEGLPEWLTFNNITGLLSGTPYNEHVGNYQFNVVASNGFKETVQKVMVSVLNVNDPPTGISLSSYTIKESTGENEFVAHFIVDDVDENDTHLFSFVSGNKIGGIDNSYFLIKGDSLLLKNKIIQLGKEQLKIGVRVTDKSGAYFEKELSLQVVDIKSAPQFISEPLSYAVQNQIYVYHIKVTDNEGGPLEISFEGLPEWLTFNNITGLLYGTPYNEHVGNYQFNVVASNGVKETVQKVMVSVLNVNDPPEIQFYPGTQYFYTGKENTISLYGCITDPDVGDKLTFILSTENNSAIPDWMSFDPLTLTISGNPPGDKRGIYSLKLTATDGGGLKDFVVFSLEVSFPTAIDGQANSINFRVFPNPVQSSLFIDVPIGNDATVSIINIAGQIIKTFQLSPGLAKIIPMNGIESGIYIVRFRQGDIEKNQKIVKQ